VEIAGDDLAMLEMVWLHMVQFRAILLSTVRFRASYVNLTQLRAKLKEETSSCIWVNLVYASVWDGICQLHQSESHYADFQQLWPQHTNMKLSINSFINILHFNIDFKVLFKT